MNNYSEEELQQLVDDGLLEVKVNEFGENTYRPTDLFYDLYPAAAQAWKDMIDECINSLWQKGYLDVMFAEEGMQIKVLPKAAVRSQWTDLDSRECDILSSLLNYIVGDNNG